MDDWEKPKPTDGIVSRYLNRKLSTRITKLIIKSSLPVTPNQMTLISFGISILTAFLIFINQLILGGIMIQISSIIDGIDGVLARAKGISSSLGAFLDATLDRVGDIAIILSVGYVVILSSIFTPEISLIITSIALSGDLMVSYIHARGEASLGKHPSKVGKLRGIAGRDVRLLISAIFVAVGLPHFALLFIGLLSYVYVVVKVTEIYINYKNEKAS